VRISVISMASGSSSLIASKASGVDGRSSDVIFKVISSTQI
jgi:hypothetical protein